MEHPLPDPDDNPLFTDVFCLNPKAPKQIMIISGIHGVEGPAGSFVQTKLIELLPKILQPDMGAIIVHALNPWGYAHGRRVDHNNVDVNRGCFDDKPPKPIGNYESIKHLVEPGQQLDLRLHEIGEILADKVRRQNFLESVLSGQYSSPDGLFYGGTSLCWSGQIMKSFCKNQLSHVERMAVLDIHSGLGDYAKGELISPIAIDNCWVREKTREWFGLDARFIAGDNTVANMVTGDMLNAIVRWMRSSLLVVPVAIEMGTVPLEESLPVVVTENWFYQNEPPVPAPFRSQLEEMFAPVQDKFWLGATWSRCLNVIHSMIQGLISF